MGSDERERFKRADGEPDVEAHMRPQRAVEEAPPEPEDRKDDGPGREDDGPEVEAHYRPSR